jgi:hypothetical protein
LARAASSKRRLRPTDDFVTVKNTHFARKGQAYYVAGANFWYGAYLGAPAAWPNARAC